MGDLSLHSTECTLDPTPRACTDRYIHVALPSPTAILTTPRYLYSHAQGVCFVSAIDRRDLGIYLLQSPLIPSENFTNYMYIHGYTILEASSPPANQMLRRTPQSHVTAASNMEFPSTPHPLSLTPSLPGGPDASYHIQLKKRILSFSIPTRVLVDLLNVVPKPPASSGSRSLNRKGELQSTFPLGNTITPPFLSRLN